jgi:hypothetical protein
VTKKWEKSKWQTKTHPTFLMVYVGKEPIAIFSSPVAIIEGAGHSVFTLRKILYSAIRPTRKYSPALSQGGEIFCSPQ